jgi:putative phage-type endonuclease
MNQLVQRSDEWFTARLGMATASRVADIVAKTKTGYSTSRANYLAQLVAERLTGKAADTFSSAAMQWGVDQEPQAKVAYEFYRDADIEEMGYIGHPSIELSGASPDGAVGSDGLVEIKCPTTATHIETLLSGAIPPRYETQMLWQMACTGRAWCDYVSFDPRMNESMCLFVKRLDRDCDRIVALELEVQGFLTEVNETVTLLLSRYQVGEA